MVERLRKWAGTIKKKISALFLAWKRPDTPLGAKIAAGAAVCYALSPIDLIPDFIPLLGYLDDLLILPVLAALAIRLIPLAIMAECLEQAGDMWREGKPKKWVYGLPILLLWALLAVFLLRLFLH